MGLILISAKTFLTFYLKLFCNQFQESVIFSLLVFCLYSRYFSGFCDSIFFYFVLFYLVLCSK